MVESISYGEIESALDDVAGESGDAILAFQISLVRRWTKNSPVEAAAWSMQVAEGPLARAAPKEVALVWAEVDLPSALTWTLQMPDGDVREMVLSTLGYEAARQEPLRALEIGLSLKPGRERLDLLVHATGQWATQNPEAAGNWALSGDSAEDKERLVCAVAVAAGQVAPEFSLRLAIEQLPAGALQNGVVISIIQRWAQKDPAAAAMWVGQLRAEPLGRIAVRNLIDVWSEFSWDAPADWLVGLTDADLRDAGLCLFVRKVAVFDLAKAVAWAEIIGDSGLRRATHVAILQMRRPSF